MSDGGAPTDSPYREKPRIVRQEANASPTPGRSDLSAARTEMVIEPEPKLDPLAELELRLAAFEQVLEQTREEMKSGTWRSATLTERMRDRATEILDNDPDSLLGSGLLAFAEEMEKPRGNGAGDGTRTRKS